MTTRDRTKEPARGMLKAERDAELWAQLRAMERLLAEKPEGSSVTVAALAIRLGKGRFTVRDWLSRCIGRGVVVRTQDDHGRHFFALTEGWAPKLEAALLERDERLVRSGKKLQAAHPVDAEKLVESRGQRGYQMPAPRPINPRLLAAAVADAQQRWPGVRTTWRMPAGAAA